MAVYLFTFHAYRSWSPDRPQGYVRRGQGILAPDRHMAELYDRDASHPPVSFDRNMQDVLVKATCEICGRNGWRLHQVRATPTHLHVLASWRVYAKWTQVSNRIKRGLGLALSQTLNRKGPWFSRGDSRKRVRDHQHFVYLMKEYLPKHNGALWCESC